jgi:hypothetical protein
MLAFRMIGPAHPSWVADRQRKGCLSVFGVHCSPVCFQQARPMPRSIAGLVLALALTAAGSSGASAWGWWDRCEGYCYGPPYGNYAPPPVYVYDHRVGPTWTGNGWAYLPVGTYHPVPPAYAPPPPPAPAYRVDVRRKSYARRHRPMK